MTISAQSSRSVCLSVAASLASTAHVAVTVAVNDSQIGDLRHSLPRMQMQ
jgi:hypothetical protein